MESRRSSETQLGRVPSKENEKPDDAKNLSSDSLHRDGTLHPDSAADLEKGDTSTGDASQAPTSEKDEKAAFLVKFEEGDKENPRNWTAITKAAMTFELGMLALVASLGSSIISPGAMQISSKFHVSAEATILCVSLYVLGFALGPSIWAPLGEVHGRKVSILPAVFILGIFSIGTAVSQSFAAVLVTRFFAGLFGSAPVANVSASLGDLYAPKARGVAVTFYAVCVVGGPTLGPVIGSALTVNSHLGWRWTEYIEAIWAFTICITALIFYPETYPPVLLKRKARRMRKETGDERWWHPHEAEKMNPKNIVTKYLSRPLRMLFTEPMVTAIAIYASFVYGILYLTLEVFPIVYREQRQWPLVVSTLPFLGLLIGVFCAMGINLANQPRYVRAVEKNGGKAVPEARLPPMVLGGFIFTAGLFWFGWTANPKVAWQSSVIATVFIGAGFNVIFQQCINFLVDSYGLYAASAVAANTVLRSLLGAGLPLVARPMFDNLGIGPAASILGGFAALMMPVPFIFMKYGVRLRKMSKFAPQN